MILRPIPSIIRKSLQTWRKSLIFFCNDKIIHSQQQKQNLTQSVKPLNSIMPKPEEGYAYGHYFPKQWSEEVIKKTLNPTLRDVEQVTIVKNKIGQHSGKVLIKFKNQKIRTKYIQKYNEDFLISGSQSQRVVILPFSLKTRQQSKKARQGLTFKYPVRISNLDFDITQQQLHKLAADYGQISHIDMNARQSGLNRGFATVYFRNWQSSHQFTNFIDGLLYRDRKLKAHFIEKRPVVQEKQFLKVPTFTFKANENLMKRLKSKEYEQK